MKKVWSLTLFNDCARETMSVYGPETKSDQKVIPKILTTLKTFFSFYGATEAPSYGECFGCYS